MHKITETVVNLHNQYNTDRLTVRAKKLPSRTEVYLCTRIYQQQLPALLAEKKLNDKMRYICKKKKIKKKNEKASRFVDQIERE